MTKKPTVSGGQLFAYLYLSRVVVTLTYSINSGQHRIGNADPLAALFLPAGLILLSLPGFFLLRTCRGMDLTDAALQLGNVGKVILALYAAWFFILAVLPAARFSFFATSAMQPQKGAFFFPVLILAAACFAAFRGTEPLLRTGTILAFFAVVGLLVITLALWPRIRPTAWYNPLADPNGSVGDSLLLLLTNSTEWSAVLMLAPQVKGGIRKPFIAYAVAAPLTIAAVFAVALGVLGDFARLQLFPFYTAAGMAKLGQSADLSALEASVWIVGVFVKTAMNLILCHRCLQPFLTPKCQTPVRLITALAAALLAGLNAYSVATARVDYGSALLQWLTFVFLFLLPLVLCLAIRIRQRRKTP